MLSEAAAQRIEIWPIQKLVFYAKNPRKNDAAVDRMFIELREHDVGENAPRARTVPQDDGRSRFVAARLHAEDEQGIGSRIGVRHHLIRILAGEVGIHAPLEH